MKIFGIFFEEAESVLRVRGNVVNISGIPQIERVFRSTKSVQKTGGIVRDIDGGYTGLDNVVCVWITPVVFPGNLNSLFAPGEGDTINFVDGDFIIWIPINSNTPTVESCVVLDVAKVFKSDTVSVKICKIGAKQTNSGNDGVVSAWNLNWV